MLIDMARSATRACPVQHSRITGTDFAKVMSARSEAIAIGAERSRLTSQ
jgi:hypothetical protein